MKILVIHQYYLGKNDGGGSRFNEFAKYWSRKRHTVTVIAGTVHYATGKKDDEYQGRWVVKEKDSENITVYRTYVSGKYNKSFLGRLWGYFSFTFSSIWAGLFVAGCQDVVIASSPPLFVGISGYVISRMKRAPLVFEVRDLWPESAIETGVLTNKVLIKLSLWMEKFIYNKAKLINVLTPAFREKLVREKGVPSKKIALIPNGADFSLLRQGEKNNYVRKKYNLNGNFVVAYIGAHGVANHLIQIIETARELKDLPDIRFMLVGDGMEKEELKKKVQEYGLENVLFIDTQPKTQIADFCNAADVCCAVLKKVDTFKTVYPNKIFDYMACARPVILAIDGVARELIEKAGAGIFVEPENIKEFKEAVLFLYNNRTLCDEFGNNGYQYAKANFSREKFSLEYEKAFSYLIDKNSMEVKG